jgi:hypothetical protein
MVDKTKRRVDAKEGRVVATGSFSTSLLHDALSLTNPPKPKMIP